MRIFLDACCLYSAGRSPGGGSAKIILLSRELGFTILLSSITIFEAKNNLIKHLGKTAFNELLAMFKNASSELIPDLSQKEINAFENITVEKDLHVLAGAIKGKANVLVTLDRKHLLNQKVRKAFTIPIMNTQEFWKAFYEGTLK